MKMVLDIAELPSQKKRQFIFLTPQDLRLVFLNVLQPYEVPSSISKPIRIICRGVNHVTLTHTVWEVKFISSLFVARHCVTSSSFALLDCHTARSRRRDSFCPCEPHCYVVVVSFMSSFSFLRVED